MNKQVPGGLTPVALLTLAAALGTLLTVGIPYILDKDPIKSSDWLGFAGAFLGAMVALIAAAYAWRGVQVQISALQEATAMALVSREEDRLERELPSLKDTRLRFARWAANFETAVKGNVPDVFIALLKEDGIGVAKDSFNNDRMTFEEVDKAFPNASLHLRNVIFQELLKAYGIAGSLAVFHAQFQKAEAAWKNAPDAERTAGSNKPPVELEMISQLLLETLDRAGVCIQSLNEIVTGLDRRIAEIEARLPRFRQIIEAGLR